MRKVISILCLGVTLVCVSCESWLDVQPKSEIKWDVMFETEQGFKDALLGCYAGLSEKSVYGAEMSCGFLEALAQQYYAENETSNSYQLAFKYMYTSTGVTNITDAIWAKLYNILANVNSVIEAEEVKGDVMTPTMRALIKAEAYSLRAYIYL
ncbi:MAG: RagB/SusD family nutrient uptake outer membrane protein, partial [Odoribacter sp.]